MDRDVVERARSGDPEAFADLVDQVSDTLLGVARRVVRDPGLAEDVLQNALLTIWRKLPHLRDPDHFEGWAFRILVHACYASPRGSSTEGEIPIVIKRPPIGKVLVLTILLAFTVTACATGGVAPTSERPGSLGPIAASGTATPSGTGTPSGTLSPAPSPTLSEASCQGTGYFEGLPAGAACWIEIGAGDDTPIRVNYTIPAPGWSAFIGTFKDVDEAQDSQRVSVLIADIWNLSTDACDQQWALMPPVGPTVEDLAVALSELSPFEVSSPPEDVTTFGYSGTHIQLRIPHDQPFDEESRAFDGCVDGVLASWKAPPLNPAFYGYVAPGDIEDFWILDVKGTRVVITALATANASDALLAEQDAVLDSIVIEP